MNPMIHKKDLARLTLRKPVSKDILILMRRQKKAASICQVVLSESDTRSLGAGLLTIFAELGNCFSELAGTKGIPTGQGNGQSKLELFQLMLPFHRQRMAGIGTGS